MSKQVLFLSHYAGRTGAPIVLLNHLSGLKKKYPEITFDILLKIGGELIGDFEQIAPTYLVPNETLGSKLIRKISKQTTYERFLKPILNKGYKIVYGNTVATCDILVFAKKAYPTIITVCHIHELEIAIKEFYGEQNFMNAIPFIDHFVAASATVKDYLVEHYKINPKQIHIHYEHIPLPDKKNKQAINNILKVFGSGTMDWRKGIDVFIQAAYYLNKLNPSMEFEFVWIGGNKDSVDYEKAAYDIKKFGMQHRVKLIPSCPNPWDYLIEADLFLLTSREDPFPLICLEAAALGKPIMCFKNSGGMGEFVNAENGWLIDYLDLTQLTETLSHILNDDEFKQKLPAKGELARLKASEYGIEIGVKKLKEYLDGIITL